MVTFRWLEFRVVSEFAYSVSVFEKGRHEKEDCTFLNFQIWRWEDIFLFFLFQRPGPYCTLKISSEAFDDSSDFDGSGSMTLSFFFSTSFFMSMRSLWAVSLAWSFTAVGCRFNLFIGVFMNAFMWDRRSKVYISMVCRFLQRAVAIKAIFKKQMDASYVPVLPAWKPRLKFLWCTASSLLSFALSHFDWACSYAMTVAWTRREHSWTFMKCSISSFMWLNPGPAKWISQQLEIVELEVYRQWCTIIVPTGYEHCYPDNLYLVQSMDWIWYWVKWLLLFLRRKWWAASRWNDIIELRLLGVVGSLSDDQFRTLISVIIRNFYSCS